MEKIISIFVIVASVVLFAGIVKATSQYPEGVQRFEDNEAICYIYYKEGEWSSTWQRVSAMSCIKK